VLKSSSNGPLAIVSGDGSHGSLQLVDERGDRC
jgi:hypothetical protein